MIRLPLSSTDAPVGRTTTVHEITVGHTRLRVDRDDATGEQTYFINGRPSDVNAYLAVTQAHRKSG